MPPGPALRRRALLAGVTGSVAGTSGCLSELRNLIGRNRTSQLALTISSPPVADDPYAARIANRLVENLELVGIAAEVDLMRSDVLFRNVLVNQDYDLFISRFPSQGDPDELYTLLHSRYGEEAGWQNPFGFSNLTVDEQLEEQRRLAGEERRDKIREIQASVVQEQPFTVVAVHDEIAGFRNERFEGWPAGGVSVPKDFLELERVGETDTVEILIRDERVTTNLNPIAAEHRRQGTVTGLMYEPLTRPLSSEDEPVPWLAHDVSWTDDDPIEAIVRLRETPWHDGEPVTASDVAFTYEFLQDTSMGEFDTPAPTPWRRGRVSLVDDVRVDAEDAVRIRFTTPGREVAERALEVPILPEHIWSEQTGTADLGGLDIVGQTTEALVWANMEPVGSGRLRFEEASDEEYLIMETFEDHFLESETVPGIPDEYANTPQFDRLRLTIAPSHDASVQLLDDDEADSTIDGLQSSVVPRIGRNPEVGLTIERADAFYQVGYNCRVDPMSNPHFRRTVARLLDREHTVENSFGGYADPVEAPYDGPWMPEELAWDGEATLPFLGADGELDVQRARDEFRELGYQYDDDNLVRRGQQ